jgi:enoyl-CoA hydratase/carnithine racemase
MNFDDYADEYARLRMQRKDGVLEVVLHSDGGPLRYDHAHADGVPGPQAEFASAFSAIASDPENRVVLITGTGDEFSGPPATAAPFPEGDVRLWEGIRRNGMRLTNALLDIDAPVISCINGPALRHAEIALLADIVLAADDAVVQDTAHFTNRTVPGDGMNVVLPLLLGYNRGRYHLLTGKPITAKEGHAMGLIAEIMPRDQLLPRGRELAAELSKQNDLVLRYSRILFTHPLKKMMHDVLGFGLALESLAAVDETAQRVRERSQAAS